MQSQAFIPSFEDHANTLLKTADDLFNQSKLKEAFSIYSEVVVEYSQVKLARSRGYIGRAEINMRLGKVEDAIRNYQHAFVLDPNDKEQYIYLCKAYMGCAQAHFENKNEPMAFQCCIEAILLDPSCLMTLTQFKECEIHSHPLFYQAKALEKDFNCTDAMYASAFYYLTEGIDKRYKAYFFYKKALAINNDSASNMRYTVGALLALQNEMFEDAALSLQHLGRVTQLDQCIVKAFQPYLKKFMEKGKYYFHQDKTVIASIFLKMYLKLNVNALDQHVVRDLKIIEDTSDLKGENYYVHKDYDRAITYLDLVLILNPHSEHAYYYLGKIKFMQNHVDEARQYFNEVLKINPGHMNANKYLQNLSMTFFSMPQTIANLSDPHENEPHKPSMTSIE